jgi:hypothetical protein
MTVRSAPGAPARVFSCRRTTTGETAVVFGQGVHFEQPFALQALIRPARGDFGAPERIAADPLLNPYAWLAVDPRNRLFLVAYDYAGTRLTVAQRAY